MPINRSPQDCPQLCEKDFPFSKAISNSPVTQKRVGFLTDTKIGNFLISTDIQGSDNHGPVRITFRRFLVNTKLCCFIRCSLSGKIKLLRTEQADAFRSHFLGCLRISSRTNIGGSQYLFPVIGLCSFPFKTIQYALPFLFFFHLFVISCNRFRIGCQNTNSLFTI